MAERRTESGIPLEAVYTPERHGGADYAERLGDPGAFPYTRGVRPPSQRPHSWIQRELSGEGGPRRSNEQLEHLLAKRQTGLDVIGDTPTVACMDPDHPFARHAVGTQGVSICRLEDYVDLYRDLPLDGVSLSHSLPALFTVAALYGVARQQGVDPAVLRGGHLRFTRRDPNGRLRCQSVAGGTRR